MSDQKTREKSPLDRKIREEYASGYKPDTSERKIGLELEFPMVYYDRSSSRFGHALKIEDTKALFRAIKQGNDIWGYTEGGLALEGVIDGYKVVIGTDFGSGTLEIGFPPAASLNEAKIKLNSILSEVIESADRLKIAILGYGMQPFTPASDHSFAPKERYFMIKKALDTDDLYYHTLTAANQVHVDSSEKEFARLLNIFNGFSPALIAVSANSAIMEGKDSGYQDFRGIVWDLIVAKKEYNGRTGIAPQVDSTDTYLDILMRHKPILAVRDGVYLIFNNTESMNHYIAEGNADVVNTLTNETMRITPEIKDLQILEGTVWWDARGKSAYGTVEVRPCALQPDQSSMLSIAALVSGIANNQDAAISRLAVYDHHNIQSARTDAIKTGLRARVGKEPIIELARDMVSIAAAGLASKGEDFSHLDPIFERIEEGKTNADISLEILSRNGPEAFIDYAKLRRE